LHIHPPPVTQPPHPLPPSVTINELSPIAKKYIENSDHLNFELSPSPHPSFDGIAIPINNLKRIDENTKWRMIATSIKLGYSTVSTSNKNALANAITKTISYHAGFPQHYGHFSTFRRWYQQYEDSENEVVNSTANDNSKKKYRTFAHHYTPLTPYTTMIQEKIPGFLHKLYRYASKVVGADAKITIICDIMNRKAANDFKLCPIRGKLKLNSYHFFRFFNDCNGLLKSPTSKP
jgi:hypothetical protein